MLTRRRLAAVLVALAVLPAVAASGAEDPTRPGLPEQGAGTWQGTRSSGITQATRAQQWLRLPPLLLATFVEQQATTPVDPSCRRHPPYYNLRDFTAHAYVTPESGTTYGRSPAFVVRALAFGAVPAEVTLRIVQPTDAEGLPEPWTVTAPARVFCAGRGPHASASELEEHLPPAQLTGRLGLRVEKLTVDGVDLGLSSQCRLVHDADLTLSSREYFGLDPELRTGEHIPPDWDPATTRYYRANQGGLLEGSVDIPAFTGCTTRDDDVSALLTGLVSSPDNPVSVRQGDLLVGCGPDAPPGAACPDAPPMPLPARP